VSFDETARAVASRYEARAAHYYVRSKLKMDPVARALYDLGAADPYGAIADVASGRGQFGLLLRLAGSADAVVGFDWDAGKVATATAAAAELTDTRFAQGDVREVELPSSDTVLLIDILHYLTREEQDDLLVRSARATRDRVIVRDVDPDRGAASVFTQSWEWVTTTLGYNRGARVAPRSFDEITAVLESEGLTVSRELCSAKGMSNVLLVARR
jgi:2-polyprenyl-3-methyl-5-hydroxy-6-metoxy-1,4-benzoquinol methylase